MLISPPIRVLFLEDDLAFANLVREYLCVDQGLNWQVVQVSRLHDALWQLQQTPFDVILSDLRLPDAQGLEAVSRFRQASISLPIVVLTGWADPDLGLEALRQGAQDYLNKAEITAPLLERSLRYAIERVRNQTLLQQNGQHLTQLVEERTAQLHQEIARNQALFHASINGIVVLDQNNNVVEANQNFARMLGYTLEEVQHLNVRDWDVIWTEEELQTAVQQIKQEMRFKTQHRRKDGSIYDVEIGVSSLMWQGQVFQLCVCQDISDRKRMEAELAASEAKFRSLVEGVNDVIWSSDAHYVLTYLSPQFKTLFGWEPDEWIGKSYVDLVHPDDHSFILHEARNSALQGHKLSNLEFRHLHQDGHYLWVRSSATPVKDAAGEVIGLQGILSNINDLKQAEMALQASETRFRQVFTSNVVGIMFTNCSGQILDANDRLLEIIRYTREDLKAGRLNWIDLTPPEWTVSDHKALKHLQRHGTVAHWEKEYYRQDGSRVPVMIGVALLSETEQMGVCIIVDISDRKEYEAQLQRTNAELIRATRLKDEFLANMSHELRTPLNAILGMTEGLQDEIYGNINERQLKALRTIEQSGSHLLELINDILDVAKIESGQMKLDFASVEITSICQPSLSLIKQQALKKHIQLEVKLPAHLPPIWADERRIRQVLINLLNNAVKFTPEGGKITLEASYFAASNYLRLSITDTGIGIAPENLTKLFQPFIQIDSALNRQYEGTGLGLALVKQIVELHGGQVEVTSQVGVGSCFTINLPGGNSASFVPELEAVNPENNPLTQPPVKISPLILLVEDNEANILTISSYLEAKGYRLQVAHNGREAIAFAESANPDLMIMDIQMPEMDGLQAMQQIRQIPQCSEVPIIALTALAMSGDRDRCLTAGATDYLTKPVKLKELAAIIQQLLESK